MRRTRSHVSAHNPNGREQQRQPLLDRHPVACQARIASGALDRGDVAVEGLQVDV
jgi:hypothetical protein